MGTGKGVELVLNADEEAVTRQAVQHQFDDIADAVQARAAAGETNAFEQLALHAAFVDLLFDVAEEEAGAGFEDLSPPHAIGGG